ncbi:hypothetical protein Q9L58_010898 [Maublancomyces gigas]|uniref:Uncharacterized protein n=1 Tax=Discina gigas TaxID=1032678 RepID=A0ABR3G2U7_9PEZI
MIVQRSGEDKNEGLNLLHLRNTINRDLIEAKAPESLQVTGISWNQKGNMILYTRDGFQNGDFDLHQATISKAVAAADPSSLFVNKQETWYKLTVHGVSLETYPDTATGMADLKKEIEFSNRDLHIITEPRYLTHPDKRQGKLHSSVVVSITDKEMYNKMTKNGVKLFGAVHKTGTYLTAQPTDQWNKSQGHGHKWARCPAPTDSCAFCAGDHSTPNHFCPTCSAKDIFTHISAKCKNCEGPFMD